MPKETPPLTDQQKILMSLVTTPIYFGKYKGTLICDLPVSYLEWFHSKGFPKDKTGELLQLMYEIKLNGLEYLLQPLKTKKQK